MFGYVRVDKPECKIKEYEQYRAVYCGLCNSLGKCCGQCARMTVSYDFTFLALVRMALTSEEVRFVRKRCAVHPLSKRTMAVDSDSLDYCAYASTLLSYQKVIDDVDDEKGLKKICAVLLRPALGLMKRRAHRKYPQLNEKIQLSLAELSQLEKENTASVDKPAAEFGKMISDIAAEGLCGENAQLARKIGFHVGKWIYITDALDDMEKDAKRKSYNPFIAIYGDALLPEVADDIKTALTIELTEVEKAIDLIDFKDNDLKAIISNIIYLGMPKAADRVLGKLA